MSKISNEVGRIDNFQVLASKLSFLPTECYIRQHYGRILYLSFKGGYLDFSHLTELRNIHITEIYEKTVQIIKN